MFQLHHVRSLAAPGALDVHRGLPPKAMVERPAYRTNGQGLPRSCRTLGAFALLSWLMAASGGCATHGHPAPKHADTQRPACYPCGPCAGYFPTCWRIWPAECPNCPVYAGEEVIIADPAGEGLAPAGVPAPPPTGDEIIPPNGEYDPALRTQPDASRAARTPSHPREALDAPPLPHSRPNPSFRKSRPKQASHSLPPWQRPPS